MKQTEETNVSQRFPKVTFWLLGALCCFTARTGQAQLVIDSLDGEWQRLPGAGGSR